ncbi:MAG: NADPH-dependent glutamate synthase [Defluviitaleaceae bacterium]|nr:NADPH-dependent glutamate synthase [Defluviitaleaceae bacterium]
MPVLDGKKRATNFREVSLGYTAEMAMVEAARCLNCVHKPCVAGCPVNVQIPEFIMKVKEGDFAEAYEIVTATNSLPAMCGRVCPQENQCEALCVRCRNGESVGIGRLERFVADWAMENLCRLEYLSDSLAGKKVAVVGAGPAGLTCAADLTRLGVKVTIFEALHDVGGVLQYGIPEFRLPKAVVAHEIDNLRRLGVKIRLNVVVGRSISVDELLEGHDAVFLGTGAGLPSFMGIEGENLLGVYSANEWLTRINLLNAYDKNYDTPLKGAKHVAVIGGGNVAMDAARCAKRVGAENVTIVYRRTENEMPARLEEIHHAKEEGIIFKLLTNPVRILGDESGLVNGLECVEMEMGEVDASGRRGAAPKSGSNFVMEADAVVVAIGTSPNPLVASSAADLETTRKGTVVADENMRTTKAKVFAGGDIVSGAATVINAMGQGKVAAAAIAEYLRE